MSQKQLRLLQELGNKNLSIEKKKIITKQAPIAKLSDEGAKIIMKNSRPIVKRDTAKESFDDVFIRKAPFQSSQSNRELAFGSCAPKKPVSQSTTKKRRITNKCMMSIGAFQVPPA
jgi:hypothetical protein